MSLHKQNKVAFVDQNMISSHAFSAFLLDHPFNGLGNANLRSVQEAIRESVPATEKFKDICNDFPNLAILTKRSMPGEVQLTFGHSTFRNKSLGESLQAFALTGDLGSPSVISFNLEIAFAPEGEKNSPPDHGDPSSRRRRRPQRLQKATGLAVPQRRPPPALPDGGRHSPWRVGRGRTPEDLCLINHRVGLGHGTTQQGQRG